MVNKDGIIHDIGTEKDILERYKDVVFEKTLDAKGKVILPGNFPGNIQAPLTQPCLQGSVMLTHTRKAPLNR